MEVGEGGRAVEQGRWSKAEAASSDAKTRARLIGWLMRFAARSDAGSLSKERELAVNVAAKPAAPQQITLYPALFAYISRKNQSFIPNSDHLFTPSESTVVMLLGSPSRSLTVMHSLGLIGHCFVLYTSTRASACACT